MKRVENYILKKYIKCFESIYKNDKIKFGEIEIQEQKSHQHKRPISIKSIYINKIAVPNKACFGKKGFKHFTGFKDAIKIRPLCMFLKKMCSYRRDFEETKRIALLIKDDELLEQYNEIWKKFKNSLKKGLDSEPVYNEKYLKTKIKSYNGKISTSFHNNKMPKEGSQLIQLSVNLIDFGFSAGKNYYPQVSLEECEHVVKEKMVPEYITDDTEISSDSDRENSDEENSTKENSHEENFDVEN